MVKNVMQAKPQSKIQNESKGYPLGGYTSQKRKFSNLSPAMNKMNIDKGGAMRAYASNTPDRDYGRDTMNSTWAGSDFMPAFKVRSNSKPVKFGWSNGSDNQLQTKKSASRMMSGKRADEECLAIALNSEVCEYNIRVINPEESRELAQAEFSNQVIQTNITKEHVYVTFTFWSYNIYQT